MQWPRDELHKHDLVARQLQQLDYNNRNWDVFYMFRAEIFWTEQFESVSQLIIDS
jgi:hypothetical protein